jgi:hypothetical protein
LLWIEHVSAGKPASISINGVPWTPTWRGKESEPFSRLETALATFVNSRVSLKRLAGRGPVTLVEQPTFANQQTISILLEDRGAGSDVYEVTVSW